MARSPVRLPEETPPRQAFKISQEPTKNSRGALKTTWVQNVGKDQNRLGTNLESAKITALDQQVWRSVVVIDIEVSNLNIYGCSEGC